MNCTRFFISISAFPGRGIPILILLLALTGCQGLPEAPEYIAAGDYDRVRIYLSGRIPVEMNRHDVRGLSIALVKEDGVFWTSGFGMADVDRQIKASPETRYRIGSVTKPLTALVIMRLHERGLIDIDRPVSDYLPGFSIRNRFGAKPVITLRALLAHHSGLPSDRLAGMWVDNPLTLEELVEEMRDESLVSEPESQYRYSNLGYSLLGRVIEVVTGKPYAQAMHEALFHPLMMESTSVSVGQEGVSDLAAGYSKGKPYPVLSLRDTPAGGGSSTVVDMAKVLGMLFRNDGTYLQKRTLSGIFRTQYPGLSLDFGHKVGLGWVKSGLDLAKGESVIWHAGNAFPHQAFIAQLPEYKLGVVILSNSMEGKQFMTELGREALRLMLAAKRGGTPERDRKVELPKPLQPNESQLARYAGNYTAFGQLVEFRHKGQRLETSLGSHKFQLLPIGEATFQVRAEALGILSFPLNQFRLRFENVDNQKVALLTGLPAPVVFTRIPQRPVPKAWRQRLGGYSLDARGEPFRISDMELKIDNEVLVMLGKLQGRFTNDEETPLRIPVVPVSDTEAVVWGLGNGEGGTIRVLDEGSLYYSGFMLTREQ